MCFESICGFSCPVALAVYYLPTVIIGLVALFIHLRRRGFFKRSYVRFLRFLRRFAVVPVSVFAFSSFGDCTPMTFEECVSATNTLHQSVNGIRSRLADMQSTVDGISEDNVKINSALQNYCMRNWDTNLCDSAWTSSGNIYGYVYSLNDDLATLDQNLTDAESAIDSISCCSSNGGNDGGGGDGGDGSSSCTNCACAEQLIAIKTSLDNFAEYIEDYNVQYVTPIIQNLADVLAIVEQWFWDSAFYWDRLTILDDDWYTYLQRLKTSVSQIRNTVTPDKISGFWNFNNILQGQAFIYSAEYKTQLLTELFGNTITQQLSQAFRLSRAFGEYEDSNDWLGIVNPDWVAAMDAYTNGGDGDGSIDDWIKGDGNVTNYFYRLETYNQQIVKFLALMGRTNDLETTSTDNPYSDIDEDYEQAEQQATSDVSSSTNSLNGIKAPFTRLYDCFVVLRNSLRIDNPSSTTSFRWLPDSIDFSQQGITSESDGLSLDLSESSYLGRGVALFNTLFSFIWVVLCVVVCGYLAFRCALIVRWVFVFMYGLVSKMSDR